jgi:hypothetical protein
MFEVRYMYRHNGYDIGSGGGRGGGGGCCCRREGRKKGKKGADGKI